MICCISNGLVIDPSAGTSEVRDIWIEDGYLINYSERRIKMPDESDEIDYYDATGKWVTPGLIDLHVHLREPGFIHKETIETGCRAAAKGGFTAVCCMPNTRPSLDDGAAIRYVKHRADQANGVRVLPIGAITKGQAGKVLSKMEQMALEGIVALSEDGNTVTDEELVRKAMRIATDLDLPIFSHAEPEEEMVERDIRLAFETGARLHFCHISTKRAVALIQTAKENGLKITAETAPHYFTLDESMNAESSTNRKMNPPLRQKEDREAILKALQEGIIDAIATDHAPHQEWEKALPYEEAPNGVIGLETSFGVSYTTLIKTGLLTPLELIDKMSTQPAKIAGIQGGSLLPGCAADVAIFDVENPYAITSLAFASKARNTPFNGMTVLGKPVAVFIKGKLITDL